MSWGPRYISNGSFERWTGAVPDGLNTQITNTTLIQLRRDLDPLDQRRFDMGLGGGPDPFIADSESALRANIVAAAAADDFRVWGPGAAHVVGLTGAATEPIPVTGGDRLAFTFYARCSVDGNLVGVRLALRDSADGNLLFRTATAADWATANTRIDLGLTQFWRRYSVYVEVPQSLAANIQVEHLVWQLSNGTAGAQLLDLDGIWVERVDDEMAA